MPIIRVSDQNSRTLETFYQEMTVYKFCYYPWKMYRHWKKTGGMMLDFLALINRLFVQTRLWGVTSHARLVIRAEDTTDLPWYLLVEAQTEPDHYRFAYQWHTNPKGSSTTWVKSTASSLAEAERHLLVAMRECGAWADNPELQRLLQAAHLS